MRLPERRNDRVMWGVGVLLLVALIAAVYAVLTSPWFGGLS